MNKLEGNQSGFTLIEALVTGAISVILAGVLLSIYRSNSSQLNASSLNIRLKQQQEIVYTFARSIVQDAQAVIPEGDLAAWEADISGTNAALYPPSRTNNLRRVLAVKRLPGGTAEVKGIGINEADYLEEYRYATHSWVPFLIGEDTVFTSPYGNVTTHFHALEWRRGLYLEVDVQSVLPGGNTITMPMPNTPILCQNLLPIQK